MQSTNYSSHSRTMTNFVIGRSRVVHLVLTSALRTKPFLSRNTACTLPRGHDPLGALGSTTKTTSPTWTLRSGNSHFWRSCRKGKYSRIHLFQKDSGFRIQDFFIFNTTQHNGYIKSTTQFKKGVRNKPTILAKMKISKLTKTRCLCYLTY